MRDMRPEDLCAPDYRAVRLFHHDGTIRMVLAVDREVPYPEGELIVSRTDPAGIVTHANPAFVLLSGYPLHELIGEPHYILRHPDMPGEVFRDLWETVSAGHKWHGYLKNLRKDGAYYWVRAVVVPNLRDGRIVGYTSVRREPARERVREAESLYRALQPVPNSTTSR
jgi:aerotaxis receptor